MPIRYHKIILMVIITAILLSGICLTGGSVEAASWPDTCIAKAQEALQISPDAVFYLVNLDGDEVPELIINYGSTDGSEELFFFDGNEADSWTYEYYAFHYIPGSNLIRINGGRKGQYYDEIYRKTGNNIILLASGAYELSADSPDRDSNGAFILNDKFAYTWMGQEVDADTYKLALGSLYDLSLDAIPYERSYNLNSLIETLRTGDFVAGNSSQGNTADSLIGTGTDTSASIEYDLTFASSDVSEYPNVRLYFGLEDESGQPVALTSFDGKVMETIAGGAEIERKVRQIQRLEGNQGLSIDIVADKSGSMEYDLSTMQSIMSDFVRSLDYAVGDQVEILSFDSYVMYMCTYTQDVSLLLNGISNMTAYGDTALYDALVTGIQNAGSRAGARCVIGFTDGADNVSVYSPDEVIRLSQDREVPVYLIGTGGADRSVLKYIADSTGGYYWDVYSISDISDILNLIYRNQKDMYCVEYESDPGADPYARRTVSCSITDGTCIGKTDNLVFQATPVVQTAPHTSRYELIKADVSWQQANEACIAKGGHLVTITSPAEMNQMVQMCEQAGIKYCWIGGYTSVRNHSAFGHWITGEPFDYTSWYPGEPSRNDLDGTPEFYLMLWKVEDAWSWNDQRNDVVADYDYFKGVIGYICEYEN